VPFSLESRSVGDITVVTCRGRIVEGDESAALKQRFAQLPPYPYFVLDLSGVDFVDSAGLGLLVRLLMRIQAANGQMTLCAVPARIREVLRLTHLEKIFVTHETEAAAIEAFYQRPKTADPLYRVKADILCVEASDDVLAYVRQLLGQAGYGVITASHLPDALTLLKAVRPKMVVIGAALHAMRGTLAADTFSQLASTLSVVVLPPGFSSHDAGEAAQDLLDRVRAVMGAGSHEHPA
jgi:anti-sigma B factor antagonist